MELKDAIERCSKLIKEENAYWIGKSNQTAITNLLVILKIREEQIERIKNEYSKIIENKDLIINEMAKFIAGLDIDELICKEREHCTGDYEYETCEECIKEYFTNKAENVGE